MFSGYLPFITWLSYMSVAYTLLDSKKSNLSFPIWCKTLCWEVSLGIVKHTLVVSRVLINMQIFYSLLKLFPLASNSARVLEICLLKVPILSCNDTHDLADSDPRPALILTSVSTNGVSDQAFASRCSAGHLCIFRFLAKYWALQIHTDS